MGSPRRPLRGCLFPLAPRFPISPSFPNFIWERPLAPREISFRANPGSCRPPGDGFSSSSSLLRDYTRIDRAKLIEMAMRRRRSDMIIIKKAIQREIIDEWKVARLRVPEMTADIIIKVHPARRWDDILVTKVVLINNRISVRCIIPEPKTNIQVCPRIRPAEGIAYGQRSRNSVTHGSWGIRE